MANILSRQGDLLKEGERLAAALAANEASLPHLQISREKLEGIVEEMRELLVRQAVLVAEKQEASGRLYELFANGTKLITFLRKGVQEAYGTRSEKLAEFGLKPFRGRPRRLAAPEPLPTPPPPVIE